MASAKLGEQIGADILFIATEVEKVALHFQRPNQKLLNKLTISQAIKYFEEGYFPAGSMGPKIEAAINFVNHSKKKAIITSIDKIARAIEGKAGTIIVK